MEEKTAATVHDFESVATAKWLSAVLEPARDDARAVPSASAIERMRARVFGETARKRARELAA